jgi:hypothetical protein
MPFYEYKVVPAPEKSPKVRGLKGPAKFAHALQTLMNELGQDGWEYYRAESLPDEERKGLTGRVEVTRNVLVFRRELYFEEEALEDASPSEALDAPPPQERSAAEASDTPDEPTVWQEPAEDNADEAASPPDDGRTTLRFSRRPLVADRRDDGTEK